MKKTSAQLKKKCRTLAENEYSSVVYSRKKDKITFQSIDGKTTYFEVNIKTIDNHCTFFFGIEAVNPSFNLFSIVLEYFAELAEAEELESIRFNIKETKNYLSFRDQGENMLHAILELIGYKESEDGAFYVYKPGTPLFMISDLLETARHSLSMFAEEHPSFEYSTIHSFSGLYSPDIYINTFSAFTVNWQGYIGILVLETDENGFTLKELHNELEGIEVEFPKLPFNSGNLNETMVEFLTYIPNQMGLPNVLKPPHYQLGKLIYRIARSNNFNASEIMSKFEELGYSYLDIEDESGRMLRDNKYLQSKEYPMPSYPLQFEVSVHDGIIKLFQHYLILMKTHLYPSKSTYAIVDSEEQLATTVLSLSEEMKNKFHQQV